MAKGLGLTHSQRDDRPSQSSLRKLHLSTPQPPPNLPQLTHHNLLNNGRYIGDCMSLTPTDILCPPLPSLPSPH